MANVSADGATAFSDFDFYKAFANGTAREYHLGEPLIYDYETYDDWITFTNGEQVIIGGTGFVVDQITETASAGTVTGLIGPLTGSGLNGWVLIEDISVSLKSVMAAALTSSTADDYAVLRTAFAGADDFDLSAQGDVARGFGGDDDMRGWNGNDSLSGDAGDDDLYGGDGSDRLKGDIGNDELYADYGNDMLVGGAGADSLYGGAESDTLVGGLGQDILDGDGFSRNRDVFDFNTVAESKAGFLERDTIQDFTSGLDDVDLRGIDARAGSTATNEAFLWHGQTAAAFSVWWTIAPNGAVLRADVTGDAKADLEVFLTDVTTLAKGDVLL